ncbi:MAG: hypothetical protein ABEN55_18480, partial [Bradymonadaceae bacterium]
MSTELHSVTRTFHRIHRYWSSRLLAGGVLIAALLGAGIGCDKQSSSETQTASAESSEPSSQDKPTDKENSETKTADKDEQPTIPGGTDPRTFEFEYKTTIQPGEASGEVDIFLPVATDTDHQKILDRTLDSPVDGEIEKESTYGNSFWHATLDGLPDEPMTITMTYKVRREVFQRQKLEEEAGTQFSDDERKQYDVFLKANEHVPTPGDLIEKVAGDIGFDQYNSPLKEARAIYDYVIDTMEYKKVGDGWGNGDTYWA